MSQVADLKARLAELKGGTPVVLAQAVELSPQDASFKRALKSLVDEGVFIVWGSTRDRRYVKPDAKVELPVVFASDTSKPGVTPGTGTMPDDVSFAEFRAMIDDRVYGEGCPGQERVGKRRPFHVWASSHDDPRRCCVHCGMPGRDNLKLGEGGGHFARVTAQRAELFSRLRQPASVTAWKGR